MIKYHIGIFNSIYSEYYDSEDDLEPLNDGEAYDSWEEAAEAAEREAAERRKHRDA